MSRRRCLGPPPATVPALRRRPLHDDVAEWLRGRISEDVFPPGTIIPEIAVATELGLSRTPVREALKVLASERLVEIVPAQGARVVTLTAEQIQEMVVVLARLEALAAELALTRISFDELAALRALHERMQHHHAAGRRSEYFKLNLEFHRLIAVASHNAALLDTWASYSNRLRRVRYLSSINSTEWDRSVADHAEMIRLLQQGEARALVVLVEAHVRGVWDALAEGAQKSARRGTASRAKAVA